MAPYTIFANGGDSWRVHEVKTHFCIDKTDSGTDGFNCNPVEEKRSVGWLCCEFNLKCFSIEVQRFRRQYD